MAKNKISAKSRPPRDDSRLHVRADDGRLSRYEMAKKAENFRTLTDWVLKTLDDRCDHLRIPKD